MENKNKESFTPGPWTFKKGQTFKDEHGNYPPQEIKVPQGLYTVYHQVKPGGATYWAHADLIDSEEDARLIAAAPELLAALEAMTENYINEVKEWGEANGEAVDLEMLPGVAEARAALKKAGR